MVPKNGGMQRFCNARGNAVSDECATFADMKRKIAFILAVLAAAALSAGNVNGFEKDWKFILKDVALDETEHTEGWRTVDLPHDWSIEGEFSKYNPTGQGGWLPAGIGWYVKEFDIPSDCRVFFQSDGIMSHSTVYVNGHEVGSRANGYASFCYDISDYINKEGENRVAVRVDNSVQPASRWYTGCGMNRRVRLVCKNALHIPYQGVFVHYSDGQVHVEADVCNSSSQVQKFTVELADRKVKSGRITLAPGDRTTVRLSFSAGGLDWWTPQHPIRQTVTVRIKQGRAVTDEVSTRYGIRTIRFDNETGFSLNGQNMKLYGVCLHSDAGAYGTVTDDHLWVERLLALRKLGVNAIRWAHNIPDPQLLDICDRLGFLVMVESFDTWEAAKPHAEKGYNLDFRDNWRIDTEDMVKSARNHPSVIIYSVGNEIRDNLNNDDGFEKYRMQQDLIHELDPTRPVTMALFRPNSSGVYRNGFAEMMDVVGQNYRVDELKAYHEAHPEKAIIGTENTHDIQSWLMLRDDPSLCGQFLWTGIEYMGEAQWPQVSWNTALLDITGAVKPLGLQRQSWWTTDPMVAFARHEGSELVLDWTPSDSASVQQIEVYSNCNEVELLLNGRSLGRKAMKSDARPAMYSVPFEPGELVAKGYNNSVECAVCRQVTAGRPYALKLDASKGFYRKATAMVVDRDGNVCPQGSYPVTFRFISGQACITGTDNADPMDHAAHKSPMHPSWRGKCVAYLDSVVYRNVLTVSAPGLKPDTLVLEPRMYDGFEETRESRNLRTQCINRDGLAMQFSYQVFGEKPRDGHSLYISMHGGGNTSHSVNDSQWENQKRLYRPAEGVYVCPRAPWDDWDMWFKAPMDGLLEELIETMVATMEVSPDKVYLMGYSAGGDGVWRLAARMADHFAAAAMMAGHPGDVHLENLRNMPFTIWVGADDAAYNRNVEVAKRGLELDSLQKWDPDGYVHETHVVAGKPHWMDLEDAASVPWMAQFVRNPDPDRIVWRQEEVCRPSFYWLSVPRDEMQRGMTVIVSRKGNTYNIERCDYSWLRISFKMDSDERKNWPAFKFNGRKISDRKTDFGLIHDDSPFNAFVTISLAD